MSYRRRRTEIEWQNPASTTYYNDDTTDPILPDNTGPLPGRVYFPHEAWMNRFMHGLGNIFSFIINKISQIVALALTVLLLLLVTRFILHFFGITLSLFAHWVYLITDPLAAPFNGIQRPLAYNGYSIDVSILVAMLVYIVLVMIIRRFLRILVSRTSDF